MIIIIVVFFWCSVPTILEATFRLTLSCHGGSPSQFDNYEIYIYIYIHLFSITHLYLTSSKWLHKFLIWP